MTLRKRRTVVDGKDNATVGDVGKDDNCGESNATMVIAGVVGHTAMVRDAGGMSNAMAYSNDDDNDRHASSPSATLPPSVARRRSTAT